MEKVLAFLWHYIKMENHEEVLKSLYSQKSQVTAFNSLKYYLKVSNSLLDKN
jgi:hypothetical protein